MTLVRHSEQLRHCWSVSGGSTEEPNDWTQHMYVN